MAIGLEEKLWIQTRYTPFKKIDLVSHPACAGGVGYLDIYKSNPAKTANYMEILIRAVYLKGSLR